MTVREYYLLKADSIRGTCLWWTPRGTYTANLNNAGVYTEDEARGHERSSDSAAIAVHRFAAWESSVATVYGGQLREVAETREDASSKLVEAARVRGRMSRGEPG